MGVPVWPAGLPQQPLVQGYVEHYPNMLVRTKVDSGPAKQRRKCSNVPFAMDVSFALNAEQKELLEEFITVSLENGALRFQFVHPTKGEVVECRLVPSDSGVCSISLNGLEYIASMQLEVLP